MNDGDLQEVRLDMKLEEANPDANRTNIYKFEEDNDKDDQVSSQLEVTKTGKKLLSLEIDSSAKDDPKNNILAMMNATQRSPKRRRVRDPER